MFRPFFCVCHQDKSRLALVLEEHYFKNLVDRCEQVDGRLASATINPDNCFSATLATSDVQSANKSETTEAAKPSRLEKLQDLQYELTK